MSAPIVASVADWTVIINRLAWTAVAVYLIILITALQKRVEKAKNDDDDADWWKNTTDHKPE